MSAPLLEIEDLRVAFNTPKGRVDAVRGVSFSLARGERLGVVGESGSGKSQTGRAILGVSDRRAEVAARAIRFDGVDLTTAEPSFLRRLRGSRMSMILQDPKFSLNPVMAVGTQIAEAVTAHARVGRAEARARARAMLEAVQIRDPDRVMAAYPHELSGGMGQRVMIAMMTIAEPDLVIADEPTSALDVAVADAVLEVLDNVVRRRGAGLIFISHDLNLVARFCDRLLIMYAGRVVESCAAADLAKASHPYTQGLLACLPRLDQPVETLATLRRDPAWASE
ncbi:MAG: ABC transporter ATP-binding protein [Pseudomonadota bacterium]